jgi:sulfite exporter TauE/SafE
MTPLIAVTYSFLFGLLHGVLPDEHTWPITFSYAIGGASGRAGIKVGLVFSAAFTLQRAIVSEVAYLALAPFLLRPSVNGIVYIVVGIAMTVAGSLLLGYGRYVHLHLLGHHHEEPLCVNPPEDSISRHHHDSPAVTGTPPAHWAIVHGFIAGFGFGGFAAFVNTIAAPAMRTAWLGFVPGLVFGLGTMISLVIVSGIVGASLRWTRVLSEDELKTVGAKTGGRSLFFGGFLFAAAGVATLLGWDRYSPVDPAYLIVGAFLVLIVAPALATSIWGIVVARRHCIDCPDPGASA